VHASVVSGEARVIDGVLAGIDVQGIQIQGAAGVPELVGDGVGGRGIEDGPWPAVPDGPEIAKPAAVAPGVVVDDQEVVVRVRLVQLRPGVAVEDIEVRDLEVESPGEHAGVIEFLVDARELGQNRAPGRVVIPHAVGGRSEHAHLHREPPGGQHQRMLCELDLWLGR
jgi:hypothetical protein